MNTFEASLSVSKIRPDLAVTFALKPAIEHALDCLEEVGILQKVTHSLWAAPVVSVPIREVVKSGYVVTIRSQFTLN